jgi:2-polyprenyl-6-methoxyphenol hydroxylase-like FAD-dependent oxidoreductase
MQPPARHGYPITFLDRQMVLQVLYDNIKDKTKVLTNKRVQKVHMTDAGVTVKTSDGSVYQGDILVGSDGIHSTVRDEMWRIANQESPGWIPADEHARVPVDYGCVFGISNPCNGIEPGASNSVFHKHESYIVNGGPEGRVYWFFFYKLVQRAYGDDIPVYTKEDEAKVIAQHANDAITPNLKFKDIIDNRITSVLVPLQEYVFRQWYYKRMITIGDAAHKVNIYVYFFSLRLSFFNHNHPPSPSSASNTPSSTPLPATVVMRALSPLLRSSTTYAVPWPRPRATSRRWHKSSRCLP